MRGGVLKYAAQATSQIDAGIGKKDHFWMETSSSTYVGMRQLPRFRKKPPGAGSLSFSVFRQTGLLKV